MKTIVRCIKAYIYALSRITAPSVRDNTVTNPEETGGPSLLKCQIAVLMIAVLMIAILPQARFSVSLFCDRGFDDRCFVIAIINVHLNIMS